MDISIEVIPTFYTYQTWTSVTRPSDALGLVELASIAINCGMHTPNHRRREKTKRERKIDK